LVENKLIARNSHNKIERLELFNLYITEYYLSYNEELFYKHKHGLTMWPPPNLLLVEIFESKFYVTLRSNI